MTRDQLLAELREVIDDEIADYGWSDTTMLGYLAEGQDVFCEETGYFTDATSYSITTANGTATYAISDRIIEVKDVWYGTQRLGKYQEEDKTIHLPPGFPTVFDPNAAAPYAWQADYETGSITLYPVPSDTRTLTLRVWRYSLYDLAGDDVNGDPAQPELPTMLQRACIEYAAYKAHLHHDMEQQDKTAASSHYQAFKMYVSRGKVARRRVEGTEVRIGGNPNYVVC